MSNETNSNGGGGNHTQGIAWMTFVIVLVLAFMSPGFKTSMDQSGRNTFAATELKRKNIEQQALPVESWNEDTFGPLQKALAEPRNHFEKQREPSGLAGVIN